MNLCDFLNPIIIISRLLGLAPFTVVLHKFTGTKVYELSKFWLIYTIIFILFQIVLQISVVYKTNFESNEVVVTKLGDYGSHICLTSVVIMEIVALHNSKKLTTALNKLSLIRLGNLSNKSNEPVMKFVSFASASFVILTIILSTLFLFRSSGFKSDNSFFTLLFITKFPSMILPGVQFINFFAVIKYKFQILNSNLISKHSYKNVDHNINKRKFTKVISSIHCSLSELAEELNYLFHAQITMSIALDFMQFT
ncbi:hypothetical protein L9F63_022103, partial [Diploptera punctata]